MTPQFGREDPAPLPEEEIGKGMYNLMNQKKIPKDVDLTPAFEKGIPLLVSKPAKIYQAEDKKEKREIQTGPPVNALKYDLDFNNHALVTKKHIIPSAITDLVLASDSKSRLHYPTANVNIETLALPFAGTQEDQGT